MNLSDYMNEANQMAEASKNNAPRDAFFEAWTFEQLLAQRNCLAIQVQAASQISEADMDRAYGEFQTTTVRGYIAEKNAQIARIDAVLGRR